LAAYPKENWARAFHFQHINLPPEMGENIPSEVDASRSPFFVQFLPSTSSTGKANVQKEESSIPSLHMPLQIGNKVCLFRGTSRNRLGTSELFAFGTETSFPSLH
jgi:hypothetical protein